MNDTTRHAWTVALDCAQCPVSECPHVCCFRRFPSAMGGANACPRIPDLANMLEAPTLGDVLSVSPSVYGVRFAHIDDGARWAIGRHEVDWHASVLDFSDVLDMPVRWDDASRTWLLTPQANNTVDTVARVAQWADTVGAVVVGL